MNGAPLISIENVRKVYQLGEVEVVPLRGVSYTSTRARWWRSWGRRARARRP
jgi:hypothetical protein